MSVPSFLRKGWYRIRAIWLSITVTHRRSMSIRRHLWRVCYIFSYNIGWPMSKTSNYNIGLKITSSIIDIKRQHQHLHHWHQDISPSHNHALSCSGEARSQYCWRWGFLTSFNWYDFHHFCMLCGDAICIVLYYLKWLSWDKLHLYPAPQTVPFNCLPQASPAM